MTIAVCTMATMAIYHLLNRQRIVSVLAAQFGAIFTIPGLRAILPDAPPSGEFDLSTVDVSDHDAPLEACVFGMSIPSSMP